MKSILSLLCLGCLLLSGCSREKKGLVYPRERVPMPEEAVEFFREHPDFFVFASPGDLPADLPWEDGGEVPELGDPRAQKGGTWFNYIPDFPRTLRFVGPDANGAFRSYILDNNALSLVGQHPDTLQFYPVLARQWAVGEDGRTVYFRLDPEATFSDGVPVRADDYLFCFYFMRSPYIVDPWYNDWYSTKYTRITKYDDLTVSITLAEAKPDLLYRAAAVRPVPVHFYSEFADDYTQHYQWAFEPTTGPYELRPENIVKGRVLTLTKVENWWAADRRHFRYRYNPDRIRCQVVRDKEKVFEIFRNGEVDIYSHGGIIPDIWYNKLPNSMPRVAGGYIHKATFYNQVPRPSWGMSINRMRPLLDNRDIREGLHHATDWGLVCKQIFRGDAERMDHYAEGYALVTFPGIEARAFDPARAAELFARAGFKRRGSDGILVHESDPSLRLSFTITTGYKRLSDALTVIREQARKAGVDYNLEIMEPTAAWKKIDEKKHDISFGAKNTSVEMYPRFWETFHSSNAYKPDGSVNTDTNNETQTADPQLDRLIETYDKATEMEEIIRLAREIVAWLHHDAAFIPAFVEPFYRCAYWRWVKWPEGFNVRTSRDWEEYHLFWLDPQEREETLEAMKEGRTYPVVDQIYDQFRDE